MDRHISSLALTLGQPAAAALTVLILAFFKGVLVRADVVQARSILFSLRVLQVQEELSCSVKCLPARWQAPAL